MVFYYFKIFDQEEKGYITEENIENFLNELKIGGGDDVNIEEISESLWQVYMAIINDENKNSFDYWDFYSM